MGKLGVERIPSVVKEAFVSPRPWRRMRMLTGEPEGGGTMSSVRFDGKSAFVGSLGVELISSYLDSQAPVQYSTCQIFTPAPQTFQELLLSRAIR